MGDKKAPALAGGCAQKNNLLRPQRCSSFAHAFNTHRNTCAILLSMHISVMRAELDDAIENLARLPSHGPDSPTRQQTLAIVSDAVDYIRALTGTLPPQCQTPLDRALNSALIADTPRVLHELQAALDTAERLVATAAALPPTTRPHPEDAKPVGAAADALLHKLRKKEPTT